MRLYFHFRPRTPNIGNDLIALGMQLAFRHVIGDECSLVCMPTRGGDSIKAAGLGAKNVYEANQLADGIVVGPGNLLENGALEFDAHALTALRKPLMLFSVSHGRIYDGQDRLVERTDSLGWDRTRALCARANSVLVRDRATWEAFDRAGIQNHKLGGCPALWLGESSLPLPSAPTEVAGAAIVSVRHPKLMSVPYEIQGRTYFDVRRIIDRLRKDFPVFLLCHDYQDLPFARAFPDVPALYTENPYRCLAWLRDCAVNVGYRLHGFLAACAVGTPAVHLAYDERGQSLIDTVGLGRWNISLFDPGWATSLEDRLQNLPHLAQCIQAAQPTWNELRRVQLETIAQWSGAAVPRLRLAA